MQLLLSKPLSLGFITLETYVCTYVVCYRYKLHVQVIDSSGSTGFILFDRNVSAFVSRSVQDLIDAQPNNAKDYPAELDLFIGKQMLFKVEVTEANLLHNWRSYAVKRTTYVFSSYITDL